MTAGEIGVLVTVLFGVVANLGVLVTFRVDLERRLTRLETKIFPDH